MGKDGAVRRVSKQVIMTEFNKDWERERKREIGGSRGLRKVDNEKKISEDLSPFEKDLPHLLIKIDSKR